MRRPCIYTSVFRDGATNLALALDLLSPPDANRPISIQQATGIDEPTWRKLKGKGVIGKL
jgi:hypothetical protein